jgi:hypothetical protein
MRREHRLVRQAILEFSLAPAGPTRGVFVLGMHRSGTSALTGMLAEFGLELSGGADPGRSRAHASNPRGDLEDRRVNDVNEGLLSANGGSWDVPAPIRRIPWLLRVRASQLIGQLTRMPSPWVIKDPRSLLCWDLWRGAQADRIGTIRHPANVVESLRKRHPERHQPEVWEQVWYVYNRRLADLYHEHPFPIVNFDWSAERYGRVVEQMALALDLPRRKAGFFETDLRHNLGRTQVLDASVAELYAHLVEISEFEAEKLGA